MTPLIRALASSVSNAKFHLLNSNVWPNVLYFSIFLFTHFSLFCQVDIITLLKLSVSRIISIGTWKPKRKNKEELKKKKKQRIKINV